MNSAATRACVPKSLARLGAGGFIPLSVGGSVFHGLHAYDVPVLLTLSTQEMMNSRTVLRSQMASWYSGGKQAHDGKTSKY